MAFERYSGRYGDDILPRDGFVYPKEGDEIVVKKDFETASSDYKNKWLREGDVGIVVDTSRKPGTFDQVDGYIGLIVQFDRVSKTYPVGFVLNWDYASDPEKFEYRAPAAQQPKQKP